MLAGAAVIAAAALHGPAIAQSRPDAVWGTGPNRFVLATGSPGELGLLEALATEFARSGDATVAWIKAGSGQARRRHHRCPYRRRRRTR